MLEPVALPNLTRDQAIERAALVTVHSYQIALDLTDGSGAPGSGTFHSVTTVVFDALAGADTVLDIAAGTVRSATLNGQPIDVSGYDESTGIPLRGLADRNVVVVDADCRYSNTGEGLHRFVDPVDDEVYLYSQFETADAKRMFACFDQPDLKATFDIQVTAPAHWQVVSNGATAEVAVAGQAKVHTFATTPRMSTYLVALIAGPYAVWNDTYRDEHGEIPLGIYCRASLAPFMDADRLFTETKQGFGFYHANFGSPYAFGKYDQLFVPEFNAGAMENAGAVTFLEDYVFRSKVTRASYERRAETVLHEMAHMWFGDLVTMTWWDDLWLNESFATFASVVPGRVDRVHPGVDNLCDSGEVVGVPPGPDALHTPDRRGHPRPARGRGQLRRNHLRQGRLGAQAAGRLCGAGAFPGRVAGLFRCPRIRQRHLQRSARRAGEGLGTRPVELGAAVAENDRAQHVTPGLRHRR